MKILPPHKSLRDYPVKLIVSLVLGAALIGGMTAAIANTDSNQQNPTTSTEECKVFDTAVSAAMQNHMSIVDRFMTSAEKGMQKAMNNSCLSAIQMLDFNLAGLIPDFNIFGRVLDMAIEKFSNFLTNQVCDAVTSVIGDWNNIMGDLKNDWNINSELERWGDGVISEVPGGNTPLLSGGSKPSNDKILGNEKLEKNCFETLAGTICTDGTVIESKDDGTGGGVGDLVGDSVNGSQVGAEYERMKSACTDAQNDWNRALSQGYVISYIERLRLAAVATCKNTTDYYERYKKYLAGSGAVYINPKLHTPTNQYNSNVNLDGSQSYSLPVRN